MAPVAPAECANHEKVIPEFPACGPGLHRMQPPAAIAGASSANNAMENVMGVSLRRTFGTIALICGFALSLSGEVVAQPRNVAAADSGPPAHLLKGREIEAPPWSFACMTDHGPRRCNEPMWVYE